MGDQPEQQSEPVPTGAEVEHRDDELVSAIRGLTRETRIATVVSAVLILVTLGIALL